MMFCSRQCVFVELRRMMNKTQQSRHVNLNKTQIHWRNFLSPSPCSIRIIVSAIEHYHKVLWEQFPFLGPFPCNSSKNFLNIRINYKMRIIIQALKVIRGCIDTPERVSHILLPLSSLAEADSGLSLWGRVLRLRLSEAGPSVSVSADSSDCSDQRPVSDHLYPGWHNSGAADIKQWSHWPHGLSNFIVEVGTNIFKCVV